jgi:hypothetical protein
MDAINDLASGLRRIAWLGPLSELAELSDDFASGPAPLLLEPV